MSSFNHKLVLACTFAGAALTLFAGAAKRSSSRAPQDTLKTEALAALSQTNGKLRVAGLREPVEVLRDRWGVPHIYARNQHDLFFAQGFVEAQDRLFQMETWKRAGQGRLAEVVGKSALPRDIAARLVRYRGSMQAEYESYAPDTREILEAFTAGINAYIRERTAPGGPGLPIEFKLAGFAPEMWKPEDCLTRMATLGVSGNAMAELAYAQLVTAVGAQKATALADFDPSTTLEPAKGVDLAGLSPALIRGFVGSDARIEFPENAEGSNNWTLSGKLTRSGKPLLANDPHRTITIPSLRYVVQLVAPGWDVIGSMEPALPGVSIGHNQDIAWGLTVFPVDQEDIFYEQLNPKNPLQYRTASGWATMRTISETFQIRGGQSVTLPLKFTKDGPVLWEDSKRALALHWVGAEPGTTPYLAGLMLDRAHNWKEFLAGLERWKTPAENFVYADRQGNIGEQSAGLTPLRKKGNGLLPAPGWGGYRWAGYVPLAQLPRQYNPARGYIATANNKVIPPNYPYRVAYSWSKDRIARIEQVLDAARTAKRALAVEDMQRLQNDVVSLPAKNLVAVLRASPVARDPAAQLLIEWDGDLNESSAAGALYEVWLIELRKAITALIIPNRAHAILPVDIDSLALMLAHPAEEFFGADPVAQRNEILQQTVDLAYAELQRRLGSDTSKWSWGRLHFMHFRHSLDRVDHAAALFDPQPVSRPGDGTTVDATWVNSENFEQLGGASYREIFDLNNWDDSKGVDSPGESGQPGSPHYTDLIPLWSREKYFPFAFSRNAVEKVAADHLELLPSNLVGQR